MKGEYKLMIKEEVLVRALNDILERTDGELENMTVTDLIVMKMIASTTINMISDKKARKWLQNWIELDIEKWLDSRDALRDEIKALREINLTLV